MNVLLLAAGFGTRLKPITDSIPKCMVSVLNRPVLDYWLELLENCKEINKIFINTHYLPVPVRDFVRTSRLQKKIELVHEEQLLGTGGTLLSLKNRLDGQDILVAHADNLTLFRIDDFIERHRRRPVGCVGTMMTFDTDSPESCGIVNLDKDGIVCEFFEKVKEPPGNLANAAVFILSSVAVDIISVLDQKKPIDISVDCMQHLTGKLITFHNDVYHRDIGTPESLATAREEFPTVYKKFAETIIKKIT